MKIEIPKSKIKPSRTTPKTMVLYGKPKVGKSTVMAGLDNNLLIDFENGAELTESSRINILKIAEDNGISPLAVIKDVIKQIKADNETNKGFIYKYITLDTIGALDEIAVELAGIMYKNTTQGKNWTGIDVRDLANGAGYRFTRMALTRLINEFENLCETLIIIGHVKDKHVELEGVLPEKALDLPGKMSSILCSQVDMVGYITREEDKTYINFKPSESLIAGGRISRLEGEKIVIATTQPDKSVKIDWTKIFNN
jgi:hypothetical protein